MSGVKEMKEIILATELVLCSCKKVFADKKLNLADLPVAMELLQKMNVVVDAVAGAKEVPAEVKDLSQEEIVELIAAFYGMIAKVKAA